jgi:spore germination protein GerM
VSPRPPRRTRLGGLLAGLVVLVAAAGCSAPLDSGPKTLRAASLPEELQSPSSTTTTTVPSGESEEVNVYYIQGERLAAVKRRVSSPVTVEKVLQKLFAGPNQAEAVSGLRSAINPDTVILGAPIEARITTVDVSKNFAFGTFPDQVMAYAQVVFTAVDVPGVTGVLFALNGERQEAPQGDGSSQSAPLGRASYGQFTPR